MDTSSQQTDVQCVLVILVQLFDRPLYNYTTISSTCGGRNLNILYLNCRRVKWKTLGRSMATSLLNLNWEKFYYVLQVLCPFA
ncbi:hypothetical protein Bpfe_021375 [Biomphalaria pfeifferi]|uniref:Uncharacterized protein n=1 Tax=Biomphalaria pfeifferi TaxID=112525 RepID=A0AAD8B823_BIOPF|nr:hypothetical protein Bpfe_021375 [Biomphalaria pfeifferi]